MNVTDRSQIAHWFPHIRAWLMASDVAAGSLSDESRLMISHAGLAPQCRERRLRQPRLPSRSAQACSQRRQASAQMRQCSCMSA
jgi:hypothetical protein